MASSINGYSTTRITGLASGMDTDTLVQNLMKSEQAKIDRLYKQNTKLQWKQSAYEGINTQLKDFRNKYMSVLSDDNLFSTNAYRQYKISMEANKYLDIKGTSLASAGSHSITGFKMAENATAQGIKHRNRVIAQTGQAGQNMWAVSKGAVKLEDGWSGKKLSELKAADGNKFFNFDGDNNQLKFKINGKEFAFDTDKTLDDVISEVNSKVNNARMTVSADGVINITSSVKGSGSILQLENMKDSPRVFADNGVFGTSYGTIKATNQTSTDMNLAEIEAITNRSFGADSEGIIRFKINGETFSFNRNTKLEDVLDEINSNTKANVTMSYDSNEDKFTIKSNVEGSGGKLILENVGESRVFGNNNSLFKIAAGATTSYESVDRNSDNIASAAEKMGVKLQLDAKGMFSFSIRAKNADGETVTKDFSFDPNKTSLKTMIDTVNGDSDINVKLNYSQITDSFTFTSGETGADASFELISKDGVNAFGGADSFFGIETGYHTGKNAVLMIDGERVEQSSNSFILDGISFNLKSNFNATVNENGEIEFGDAEEIDFSVTQDIDSVVDKVKNFVEEYNQLVAYLNELISEERDYDYEPLSESERESLSEADIEKWEEQAKKGLMRNDSQISGLLSQMRMSLFETVGDTGLSPHDIGLTTGSWMNKGQITFDENKFRAALAENPDKVAQVMAGTSSSKDEAVADKESGIMSRFFTQMSTYEKNITQNALANTKTQISSNETKMSEMLERMYELEEKYYLQFAQMEKLMSSYQSQSTWLTQQLGSM